MKIPNKWLNYNASAHIRGTRFIAFKTPLREGYSRTLTEEESFTPRSLLQKHPEIKLVIDLTFTAKYYNGAKSFKNPMRLETELLLETFTSVFLKIVDEFIAANPEDYLIGVHCTHGVHRTGYFVVKYMIERLKYTNQNALKEFLESRGHAIKRTAYIRELLKKEDSKRL